ncbi:acyltransferase [Methyloparacoccus murrellii]
MHSSARVVFRGIAHVSSQFKMEVFPGASVTFGERLFINRGASIVARYGVDIGQDCMIGEYVTVYDHNHVFDQEYVPFNQQGYRGAKVMIGNNVWIGSHVFIGKGVTIGDNVVIGAGCIIAVDIPSNMIVRQKRGLILSRIRYKESK